jgi:hypothetical protein
MEARWQGQSFDDALAAGVKTAVVLEEFELAVLSGCSPATTRDMAARRKSSRHCTEVEFRMPVEESRTFEAYGFIDGLGCWLTTGSRSSNTRPPAVRLIPGRLLDAASVQSAGAFLRARGAGLGLGCQHDSL